MSLEALKEQMLDIEKNITSTTLAVGDLHCFMDKVGVSVPDISEKVVSIMFSEVTLSPFSLCTSLNLPDRTEAKSCRITHFSKMFGGE